MKHHSLWFLLLLGGIQTLWAQGPQITKGPVMTDNGNSYYFLRGLIEGAEGKFYSFDFDQERSKYVLDLEEFGADLKLNDQFKIDVRPPDGYKYDFEYSRFIQLEGRHYLILGSYDKKNRLVRIHTQEVDLQARKLVGQIREVGSLPGLPKQQDIKLSLQFSRNKSKLLIYSELEGGGYFVENRLMGKDKKDLSVHFLVFDGALAPLWQYNLSLPEIDAGYGFMEPIVSDEGKVAWIRYQSVAEGRNSLRQEVIAHRIVQGKELPLIDLSQRGRWLGQAAYDFLPSGELVCSGYYGDEDRNFKGVFYNKYSATSAEPIISQFELAEDNEDFQIDGADRLRAGNLLVNDLVLKKDGGLVFISQVVGKSSYTYESANMEFSRTNFLYKDLVLVSMDPEGFIDWTERLPIPEQATGFSLSKMYSMAIFPEQIVFFLTQTPDMSHLSGVEITRFVLSEEYANQLEIEMMTVSLDGEQERMTVMGADETGHAVNYLAPVLQSGRSVILQTAAYKSPQFIKLEF